MARGDHELRSRKTAAKPAGMKGAFSNRLSRVWKGSLKLVKLSIIILDK
jgi:hypothetical protein